MKTIYITGSRRYFLEMKSIKSSLNEKDIEVSITDKKRDSEDVSDEKATILRSFKSIDECDIVYVFAKEGYVDRIVMAEMSYAYAKNKEVFVSENVLDGAAQALVTKIINPEELLEMILSGNIIKKIK